MPMANKQDDNSSDEEKSQHLQLADEQQDNLASVIDDQDEGQEEEKISHAEPSETRSALDVGDSSERPAIKVTSKAQGAEGNLARGKISNG